MKWWLPGAEGEENWGDIGQRVQTILHKDTWKTAIGVFFQISCYCSKIVKVGLPLSPTPTCHHCGLISVKLSFRAKTLGNKCSVRVRIFSWRKGCESELPRRAQAISSLSNEERTTINLSERNKWNRQPREAPVAFPFALTMTDGSRAQTGGPLYLHSWKALPSLISEGDTGCACLKSWHTEH